MTSGYPYGDHLQLYSHFSLFCSAVVPLFFLGSFSLRPLGPFSEHQQKHTIPPSSSSLDQRHFSSLNCLSEMYLPGRGRETAPARLLPARAAQRSVARASSRSSLRLSRRWQACALATHHQFGGGHRRLGSYCPAPPLFPPQRSERKTEGNQGCSHVRPQRRRQQQEEKKEERKTAGVGKAGQGRTPGSGRILVPPCQPGTAGRA